MDPVFGIFFGVLLFMWIMFLWELYLGSRQHQVYVNTKEVPEELKQNIDNETFEKSRVYQVDKSNFGFIHSIYSQIESTLILVLNGIPLLWALSRDVNNYFGYDSTHEIKQSCIFLVLATLFSTVMNIPWSLYSNFIIEEKHGFNKQTLGFFLKDTVKKTLISTLIALPVITILIWTIKWGGEYFFIYTWLFMLAFSLFMVAIYHDYIAPLFDTFIPLPEGHLRNLIEALAKRLEFPLGKILVVEGSKRSSHSNAYFFGFYKNKVIVLFDTLLKVSPFAQKKEEENKEEQQESKEEEKTADESEQTNKDETKEEKGCSDEEILAILGHELGHWKLSHNLKNLCISQVNLLFSLFAFGLLMNLPIMYESFGFHNERPVLIGLVIIMQFIFSPYNELVGFLMTILSRRFEFQADEFGKSLGYAKDLQSALIKLHKENLSFPVTDPLYSAYHYSHPPLLERLRALKQKQE